MFIPLIKFCYGIIKTKQKKTTSKISIIFIIIINFFNASLQINYVFDLIFRDLKRLDNV